MEITNDPDGKIARENAERKAREKKAAEKRAGKPYRIRCLYLLKLEQKQR